MIGPVNDATVPSTAGDREGGRGRADLEAVDRDRGGGPAAAEVLADAGRVDGDTAGVAPRMVSVCGGGVVARARTRRPGRRAGAGRDGVETCGLPSGLSPGRPRGPDDVSRGYAAARRFRTGRCVDRAPLSGRAAAGGRRSRSRSTPTTSSVSTSLTWWAPTYSRASIVHSRDHHQHHEQRRRHAGVGPEQRGRRDGDPRSAVPVWPDGKLWSGTSPDCRMCTGGRCRGSSDVPGEVEQAEPGVEDGDEDQRPPGALPHREARRRARPGPLRR